MADYSVKMNIYATRTNSYEYGGPRMSPTPSPNGKTLVEGYRNDIMTGFQKDPPRFNPVCKWDRDFLVLATDSV